MRQFFFSYKQVKYDYSLPRVNAVICGMFNITVNWDHQHAQNQGKLASVCLQRFSSIFETSLSVSRMKRSSNSIVNMCFISVFLYMNHDVVIVQIGLILSRLPFFGTLALYQAPWYSLFMQHMINGGLCPHTPSIVFRVWHKTLSNVSSKHTLKT